MSEQSYLFKVFHSLPPDHPLHSNSIPSSQHQKVLYTAQNGSTHVSPSLSELLQHRKASEAAGQIAVCLVENIGPDWIATLGIDWAIEPGFFARHALNPSGNSIWEALMNPGGLWESWTPNRSDASTSSTGHIDGFFEHLAEDRERSRKDRFPKRIQRHPRWGLQSNSAISYCRVSSCLYLILTDLPFRMSSDSATQNSLLNTHLFLHVPFSGNYGGLSIPQEYDRDQFSAFDIFTDFLQHAWQWRILFAEHLQGAVRPMILSSFLAASLWRANSKYLRQCIHSIAFRDVRRPSILINDRLHDKRQELAGLQAQLYSARKWMLIDDLDEFLRHIENVQPTSPHSALDQVLKEADDLYQFLMDTFQLLMGSISVLDSQTSLEEAKRSTTLTQLAAIYLPLSLATGIFGMNVKEINDSPLSVWVVSVALAILIIGTALLLLGTNTV